MPWNDAICAHCGLTRGAHTDILKRCPGREYSYFDAKFQDDGTIDAQAKDCPVCPHCGERDHDYWDGGYKPEETVRVTCDECERDYDCECIVEYSFTSTIPDLVQEAKDDARRRIRQQEYVFDRLMAADEFEVGARVRDKCGDNAGRVDAIDDQGWLEIVYDRGHTSHRTPQAMEVID